MTGELSVKRHTNYFNLCLGLLPPRTQKEDSSKLMLVYCAVGGLCLLGHNFTSKERTELVELTYSHLVPVGNGFRGSSTHSLPSNCPGSGYDPATIANTYAALCILLMLKEDYTTKLDKLKIMDYVRKCQLENGGFKAMLDIKGKPYGDGDLRQCYMAVAIRKMLKYEGGSEDIDLEKLEKHVLAKKVYDGGIGDMESHSGYTFCGLATLKLIGKLNEKVWDKTVSWLAHRQIGYSQWNESLLELGCFDIQDQGAHNGRDNKFGDTCYSFWCTGSLALLGKTELVEADQLQQYLLGMTQNGVVGGFGKTEEDDPDPYHSFLALAALSLVEHPSLKPLDSTLVVTADATAFLETI